MKMVFKGLLPLWLKARNYNYLFFTCITIRSAVMLNLDTCLFDMEISWRKKYAAAKILCQKVRVYDNNAPGNHRFPSLFYVRKYGKRLKMYIDIFSSLKNHFFLVIRLSTIPSKR